ncbi:hypothetical protein BC833DRAFT_616255 [Globomyces pollinis-pini]|nr:hypothetical protein BC833DRAFT_616255 [Globomyces pollinis-pini]
MSLSYKDQKELMEFSQIREEQEIARQMAKMLTGCYDKCVTSFLSGKMNDSEIGCFKNCILKEWQYFERAQSASQEYLMKMHQQGSL